MANKTEKTIAVAFTLTEVNFIQKAVKEAWLRADDVVAPKYYKLIFKKLEKVREEF
jgi:hypothetical protein